MGREEKRQRKRIVKQLERRLRRKPSEEEIEKALAERRETRWKKNGRRAEH
jgi:DNA-directed RNA polymerase specialized sigma subunit